MNNEICLVTGGAGFIGCEISHLLVREFKRVIVLDKMHPQIHKSHDRPSRLSPEVDFIVGDICDDQVWDQILSENKPSVIIHLAAETGTGQSLTESSRHAEVNVLGTTKMLDALNRNNALPRKIILSSSRAIYGEGKWINENGTVFYPGQRTKEQLERNEWDFGNSKYVPLNNKENIPMPTSIYGATKLAQENIISSWCNSYDISYTILRFQNVYGPGQSLINSYTGIVSLFARLAKENSIIPLYEDGEMLRDFVYIEDVAEAIYQTTISRELEEKVLDIGSGYAATIREAAEIIADHYGASKPVVCGKYRNGDVRHASCNIQTTLKVLNWKPKFKLNKGLITLCDWIDLELENS